jgi:hypothetical protein
LWLPVLSANTLDNRRICRHNHDVNHEILLKAFSAVAQPGLLPIRILAIFALLTVISAFVYVLRHLKKIEKTIVADNLVPGQRGPRNNVVLIMCAIPIIVVSLLVYLIINA